MLCILLRSSLADDLLLISLASSVQHLASHCIVYGFTNGIIPDSQFNYPWQPDEPDQYAQRWFFIDTKWLFIFDGHPIYKHGDLGCKSLCLSHTHYLIHSLPESNGTRSEASTASAKSSTAHSKPSTIYSEAAASTESCTIYSEGTMRISWSPASTIASQRSSDSTCDCILVYCNATSIFVEHFVRLETQTLWLSLPLLLLFHSRLLRRRGRRHLKGGRYWTSSLVE